MPGKDAVRRNGVSCGFSLIELIVAVSMVSILLSLALPSFRTTLLNSRRISAANEFVAALTFARSTAITRRGSVTVCRSDSPTLATATCASAGDWRSGWIVFHDEDSDGVIDEDDMVIRRHEGLGDGLTLLGNASVQRRITFRSVGSSGNNGRVVLCDRRGWTDDARIFVIATSGRIRTVTKSTDPNPPLSGCSP